MLVKKSDQFEKLILKNTIGYITTCPRLISMRSSSLNEDVDGHRFRNNEDVSFMQN